MENTSTFFCTSIPEMNATPAGELVFAVLVTPIIRGQDDTENVPKPFDDWPAATGLPFQPKLVSQGGQLKLAVTLTKWTRGGGGENEAEAFAIERPDVETRGLPAGMDPQALAGRLWRQTFRDARVVPVAEGKGGATKVREEKDFAKEAPQTLAEAAEALRGRVSTVEGIGTQDLMDKVVVKLLHAHFFNDNDLGPDPRQLDELAFALERLDRLGSAGSTAAATSETASRQPGQKGKADEFHELLSAVGDDRALLRWLGLVFRVRVKVPAAWLALEQRFDVKIGLEIEGGAKDSGNLGLATPCRWRPRAAAEGGGWVCHVDCDRDYGSPDQDSLVGAGFLAVRVPELNWVPVVPGMPFPILLPAKRLDTVQVDTVAILRAALRDRDARNGVRQPGDDSGMPAKRAPHERRSPVLLGHGITIYRTEGSKFLQGTKESLTGLRPDSREPGVWNPEDIARGYVVDVRVQPRWGSVVGKFSDWIALCRRQITYTLPSVGADNAISLPPVEDEACLSVSTSEGATPLAGFLLGPLDYGSQELADAEAAGKRRRPLSGPDCDALGYPTTLAGKAINHFLLATPGGMIVVADVPTAEELQAGDRHGPISRRLAELTSDGAAQIAGGWVDLTGTTAASGGYFLAVGAEFADEFLGAAGVLQKAQQERVVGEDWPFLEKTDPAFAAVALERQRFTLLSQLPASAETEISLPWLQDRLSTLLFFRFPKNQDGSSPAGTAFADWMRANVEKNADAASVLALARGEAVLAVRDPADLALVALKTGLDLVFTRIVEGRKLEFRPYFSPEDPAAEALPVFLTLAADPDLRMLTQEKARIDELPEGSRFEVHLKRIEIEAPDFEIIRMREIGRDRDATLLKISPGDRGHLLQLRIDNQEGEYFAPVDATIEVRDFAGPKAPEPDKDGSITDEPETFIRGRWAELAHLLQRGDLCEVRLGLGKGGRLNQVEVLTVKQRDRANYYFGFFRDLADGSETKTYGHREDVFMFNPLVSAKQPEALTTMPVLIDDATTLVTGAPFAAARWRTRQLPPLKPSGGVATLVRVFLDPPPARGGLRHVRMIELHHVLRGELVTARAGKLTVRLQDFGDAFLFTVPNEALDVARLPKSADGRIEVLANETHHAGELRLRTKGRLETTDGKTFFTAASNGERYELTHAAGASDSPGEGGGTLVELRFRLVNEDGQLAPARVSAVVVRDRPGAVRVQLKRDGLRVENFAVDARVLRNDADYFAPAEGRDRILFLLPALWKAIGENPAGLLHRFIESQLPLELPFLPGVLIDETAQSVPGAGAAQRRQWWSFHALIPPKLDAFVKPRSVFVKSEAPGWIKARTAVALYFPPKLDRDKNPIPATEPLWTVAYRPVPAERKIVPPPILATKWAAELADDQVLDAKAENGEELLPDQVIVDDALVHWFGNSLAKNEKRRASFDSVDEASEAALEKHLGIKVTIPEGHLPPLRIDWKYEFRLRAVWITADPTHPRLPFPEVEALLPFHPFGSKYPELDRFLRVEPFHPPRLGWPHTGNVTRGAPHPTTGWVKAPDVECPEQAEARDHLRVWGVVPPRVAERLEVKGADFAGTPTDLIVRTDRAGEGKPAATHPLDFANIQPLDRIAPIPPNDPRETKIVLRPAEIAHREAERLGKFEQWEAMNLKHTLYWDVLWACDEVEDCDAWWTALSAYREHLHTHQPTLAEEAAFYQPETKATEGRILHRLPDPHAHSVSLAILQETSPGQWSELHHRVVDWFHFLEPKNGSTATAAELDRAWPGCRELQIIVRRQARIDGNAIVRGEGDRTVVVQIPPDAEWQLAVRTLPSAAGLAQHALLPLAVGRGMPDPKDYAGEIPKDYVGEVKLGRHPLLEPATRVRLRHATNQPRQAPRKITLRLAPRGLGDTDAKFQGRYEIDRPSTGALLIQAALEMDCVDDPAAPLPRVPAPELSRVLAVSRDTEEPPQVTPATGKILGRSSDSTRTLRLEEFSVSELDPDLKTVSPFGPTEEPVQFTHRLGETRHRRIYYRVLAVSRWEALFFAELRTVKPPPEQKEAPPLCHTNPLRGPFSPTEATTLERAARKAGEVEPWRWHRVEIPATKRPEVPVLPAAQRLRTAFAWNPHWTSQAQWTGGGGRWHFSRTRLPVCRVWLARPWYSSGADEKLAVLCLHRTRIKRAEKERTLRTVTRWAVDGAGTAAPDEHAIHGAGLITRASFLSAEPGSPAEIEVPPSSSAGAATVSTSPKDPPKVGAAIGVPIRVGLAVHTPRFHAEERQWFCDLYLQPKVYRPFLYLSLARYQPHAIPGVALSEPMRPHPVQVLPSRTLDISLIAEGGVVRAEITVTGLISAVFRREVICKLQRLAGDHLWPQEEVPENFDPRTPPEFNPAAHAPASMDLGPRGEFWQSLTFRRPETPAAYLQHLTLLDPNTGTYRGVILIESHHRPAKARRLRLSVEELEIIPLATEKAAQSEIQGTGPQPPPAYFDQVELHPLALDHLNPAQPSVTPPNPL